MSTEIEKANTNVLHDVLGVAGLSRWAETVTRGLFSGLSRIYEDGFAVALAKRRSSAAAIHANAKTNFDGYAKLTEAIDRGAINQLETRASLEFEAEAVRRQRNLESVGRYAIEYINLQESDTHAREGTSLDEDWLEDFRDLARKTNKEEMQRLLGKIISEQATGQNEYSVATILKIKTISKKAMVSFTKINMLNFRNFGIIDIFGGIYAKNPILKRLSIDWGDFLLCGHEGLIYFDGAVGMDAGESGTLQVGRRIFSISAGQESAVSVHGFTDLGKNLCSLIEVDDDPEYTSNAIQALIAGGFTVVEK